MTELRDEIKQTRPFQSLEQEAHLNVVRTAALLTDHFERMLSSAGITAAQYNVLRILRGAESHGLCRNDLRDRMVNRMPDMTRLLDRMEAAGLVDRSRDAEDRRLVTTRITDRGKKKLEDLEDAVIAEHQRRLGGLSKAQLNTLVGLLSKIREMA